jgi:hypothetical protein
MTTPIEKLLVDVSLEDVLNRGINGLVDELVTKYYPAPLAIIVPPQLFLFIVDQAVRNAPHESKVRGIVFVKERIDALVDMYLGKMLMGKGDKNEIKKIEAVLRKLGLLY